MVVSFMFVLVLLLTSSDVVVASMPLSDVIFTTGSVTSVSPAVVKLLLFSAGACDVTVIFSSAAVLLSTGVGAVTATVTLSGVAVLLSVGSDDVTATVTLSGVVVLFSAGTGDVTVTFISVVVLLSVMFRLPVAGVVALLTSLSVSENVVFASGWAETILNTCTHQKVS